MSALEITPIFGRERVDTITNYLAVSGQIHIEGKIDEMKSSPIRRTLCLIVLVDLIMIFILWIIHVENVGFIKEVKLYAFKTSLFDIMMLTVVRFIFLEVMYGGFKSKSIWWISISTTITSGFVIVKLFMGIKSRSDPWEYVIIILGFLFAWIETLFLVNQVLPKEKAAENVMAYQRALANCFKSNNHMSTPIYQGSENSHRASPVPSTFDDEFYSTYPTRPASPENSLIKEYQSHANALQHLSMSVIRDTNGWTYAGGDAIQGCVSYKQIETLKGKTFKIETLLNVSAEVLFRDMIDNCEQSPNWNRHVRLVKKIENVSNNIDIIYNLSNEALNGYIKPRDYVLLRTWGVVDQCYLISFVSIVHDEYPTVVDVVRGEYGLGTIFLQCGLGTSSHCSLGNSSQCRCIWLMNNDIKGRLFKSIVDRAVPGILLEIIGGLRLHCASLSASD